MKLFDFSKKRITLVVCPLDLRYGYRRLSTFAMMHCGINMTECRDVVVFVSKRLQVAKVIFNDERGANILTRYLHDGGFKRILMAAEGEASCRLSKDELERYLNGMPLQVARENFYCESTR